jgi:hypothetical protein
MTSPPVPVVKSVIKKGSGVMAVEVPSGLEMSWAPTRSLRYWAAVRTMVSTPVPVVMVVEKDPATVMRSLPVPPSTVTEV